MFKIGFSPNKYLHKLMFVMLNLLIMAVIKPEIKGYQVPKSSVSFSFINNGYIINVVSTIPTKMFCKWAYIQGPQFLDYNNYEYSNLTYIILW